MNSGWKPTIELQTSGYSTLTTQAPNYTTYKLVRERALLKRKLLLPPGRQFTNRRPEPAWIWSRMQSSFPGHAGHDWWLISVASSHALMQWWWTSRPTRWFTQCASWRGAVGSHRGGRGDLQWCWCRVWRSMLFWRLFAFRTEASQYYLQITHAILLISIIFLSVQQTIK